MTRRPRDLTATRAAILEAARDLFTEHGYAGVGVREIADSARADKALIARYFGSKEGLFVEAVPGVLDIRPLLEGDRATFGRRAAEGIVADTCNDGFSPTMAMLRSLGDPSATKHLREGIERGLIEPLAAWIGGKRSHARATLLLSQMFGFWIAAGMMPLGYFRSAKTADIVAEIAPILQAVIDCDS